MAIEYSITLHNARVHSQDELIDVVKELDVSLIATDGQSTISVPFMVELEPANPENFSTFDKLTEEEMISWVWAQTDVIERNKAHVELILNKEIEKGKLVSKDLPWKPASPSGYIPLTEV